jgi:DNA-binding CsgD family transcriptional regulator
MARLTRADMEAALAFAAEVGTAASEPDRADEWMLERIAGIIHSERAGYDQVDVGSCRVMHDTVYPTPVAAGKVHGWDLAGTPNPFTLFAQRSGDTHFRAHRLTDLDRGSSEPLHSGALERVLPYAVQTRLPGEGRSHWTLELERSGTDYTDRELLLLDALRHALLAYESHRVLAAEVARLAQLSQATTPRGTLSARENEILDLVARGATNGQIAEQLWLSPATVKKHLENVYAKLEVGSRTAALAQTGRSLAADSSSPRH